MPLTLKYPEWSDTVATDSFRSWMTVQPEDVRLLANSNVPQDAIQLLDRYEGAVSEAHKATKASVNNRLENAVAPTKGNTVVSKPSVKSENDDFEAGFYNSG